jgi:hypothetical protein
MRLRKFYDSLRKIRKSPSVETIKVGDGYIVIHFKDYGGKRFCPLTAVAYYEHNKPLCQNDWNGAADLLGVPHDTATKIVKASDHAFSTKDYQTQRTRKAILNALGLAG